MVFPFELFCRECGSLVFSVRSDGAERLMNAFQADLGVASWLSENLRGRKLVCPRCKRKIEPDPLVRADVLFSEWGESSEADRTIVYYV